MKTFKKIFEGTERRFRASIYVDVWIESTDNLEVDRKKAEEQINKISDQIPNSYVGGVAVLDRDGLMIDEEI